MKMFDITSLKTQFLLLRPEEDPFWYNSDTGKICEGEIKSMTIPEEVMSYNYPEKIINEKSGYFREILVKMLEGTLSFTYLTNFYKVQNPIIQSLIIKILEREYSSNRFILTIGNRTIIERITEKYTYFDSSLSMLYPCIDTYYSEEINKLQDKSSRSELLNLTMEDTSIDSDIIWNLYHKDFSKAETIIRNAIEDLQNWNLGSVYDIRDGKPVPEFLKPYEKFIGRFIKYNEHIRIK